MNIIIKKEWIYRQALKYFIRKKKSLKTASYILVLVGGLSTGIPLNPVLLAAVSAGLILYFYLHMLNIDKKIESYNEASTTHQKILNEIRTYLRGNEYHHNDFINKLKTIDNFLIETTANISDNFEKNIIKESNKISNNVT